MLQCDEKDFKPITTYYCTSCAEKDQHIEELEDAIRCSNLLIEQLENQNDRLIKQRDDAEQELALYKKALELACESFTMFMRKQGEQNYDYKDVCLQRAKEILDEQKTS